VSWAKFRVAAVSVASLAILAVLVYLLSGGTLLQEKVTLYLYIPDATGVSGDSPVRVDGIGVGQVKAVDLTGSTDRNRIVRVTLEVQRERLPSIPADSSAQLSTDTLIGDKFVDISSGTSPQHIPPGGELPYKEQTELFKTLDLAQFESRLHEMDALLSDLEQGKGAIGQAIQGDQIYNDLRHRLADLQTAMKAATSTTSSFGQALYTDKLYRNLSAPFVQLDQALARVQSGQGPAGQLLRDTAAYASARQMARDLQRTVADLHASEFMQSDQLYNDWNRSLIGFIRNVDQVSVNPLLSTTQVYENLNGVATELRDTLKDFRGKPRKFLRLKVF
jgi:phospholipid/cholesterol/gamma-HCH transport system substrate-binding protein